MSTGNFLAFVEAIIVANFVKAHSIELENFKLNKKATVAVLTCYRFILKVFPAWDCIQLSEPTKEGFALTMRITHYKHES